MGELGASERQSLNLNRYSQASKEPGRGERIRIPRAGVRPIPLMFTRVLQVAYPEVAIPYPGRAPELNAHHRCFFKI
jgi:hypothetical protein